MSSKLTLEEIKKEFFKAKKEKQKELANAYMMLIDCSQKIAKEGNMKLNLNHIELAAKKLLKQAEDTLKSKGVVTKEELELYKKYLPKTLSIEETEKIIKDFINKTKDANLGSIMKHLKSIKNIDMKIASQIANKVLKENK